jgi:hypothetical protein
LCVCSTRYVKGVTVAPKSRHGARLIPLTPELAATLRAHRPPEAVDDVFAFPGRDGGASDQGSLRRRALVPAAEHASTATSDPDSTPQGAAADPAMIEAARRARRPDG